MVTRHGRRVQGRAAGRSTSDGCLLHCAAMPRIAQTAAERPPPRGAAPGLGPVVARSRTGCLRRLVGATLVLAAVGAGALGLTWAWLDASLPDVYTFEAYRGLAHEASRIQAAGGEVVATFGEEVRTVVGPERIPPVLRAAIVCAEDAGFWQHPGLDVLGIARALWRDAVLGRYAQGASTLTQQFAKTRFLGREKTLWRKARELVLARKLETRLTKEDILALYANEVYFGHGRYGVEEAARFYFGRSASELDVAQAALLAGVVNSPARFSPLRHPERARQRRSYVLDQMVRHRHLGEADRVRAEAEALPARGHDTVADAGAWYVETVRRFVIDKVGRDALVHGGLRVEVAMDLDVQRAAEAAVRAGLQRIDATYRVREPVKHYADTTALQDGRARLAAQQAALFDGGRRPWGRILVGIVEASDGARRAWQIDLGGVTGWLPQVALGRYLPLAAVQRDGTAAAAKSVRLEPGDLVRVSLRDDSPDGLVLSPEFGPQAALAAVEPKTRLVRALVGGDDFALHPFDRATQARRQPGSTFKTFAYGAALDAGLFTPETEMLDVARGYRVGRKTWTPRNFSGRHDGKLHTLRDALAQSINSIAVEVAAQVGPQRVEEFARRLGIESRLQVGLPLALGASAVGVLELANAYATIAADGVRREPILVTRIVGRDGKDLWQAPRDNGVRVLADGVVRALVDMLGEVVQRGSGREAKVGRPVAGKTGTSNGGRDAWFVGFAPELCAAVWVGWDDRKPMPKATGGTLAVPIWSQFMREALDRVPVRPLPRLPHVLAGPGGAVLPVIADGEAGAEAIDDGALGDEGELAPAELVRPPPLEPAGPEG
ncbi:MAG: PBP1A family penicillin-binding protein [Myxococcales bacterium]|nr:PBP1A family penicillin-binding protein [Myxococcales bacterium]